MKKFVFSLEKVLNVKTQLEEVKRNELMQLQQELVRVEDAIEENRREFARYNEEVNSLMSKGTTSNNIDSYKRYFTVLDNEEKRLIALTEEIKLKIAEKQQEIIEVKTEISGMEKLKEKQWAEYNKGLQKQQERELEEFLNEQISGAK